MIQIINNELHFKDGTFYNLDKTKKQRVSQGLKSQLDNQELTISEYEECSKLINLY